MSNAALNHVWKNSQAKGSALLVMIAIADMANDDGECWPGQTRLAAKCRMTDRYLRTLLTSLSDLGEIEVHTHGGTETKTGFTNLYKVVGVVIVDHEGRNSTTDIEDFKGGTGTPPVDVEGGTIVPVEGGTIVPTIPKVIPKVKKTIAPAAQDSSNPVPKSEHNALFDVLAETVFDAKPGTDAVKMVAARVGILKRWCMGGDITIGKGKAKRVLPGCTLDVTPDYIRQWAHSYRKKHTGASMPRDVEKFAEHFYPWLQADSTKYVPPTPKALTDDEILAAIPGGL